jgi:glycosyltransferase involved in cell wall biosynthesis
MNFFYFTRALNPRLGGFDKKISSQVSFLKKLGVNAIVVNVISEENARINKDDFRNILIPKSPNLRFRIISILFRERQILRILWQVISQLGSNDILYLRFDYPFFYLWYYLQKKRKCKIVFEHQSLESREYLKQGKFLYPLFDLVFGSSIRRHCDGIVGVTEEITNYQVNRTGDKRKPHVTIGNGIDVNRLPPKKSFSFNGSQLHLLSVANVMGWHGIDRVIQGMIEYRGEVKIYLHIVGSGREISTIKKMVNDRSMDDSVFFYGPLSGEDLDQMFNRSDIALGSLGIHRIGLHQASTLKAREYCARGIPFIYGTNDVDFPPDFPYILHVPPDDSPIDMRSVIEFAKGMYSDLDFSLKMRMYAKQYLDWSVKAQTLKQFLDSIM